MTPITKYLSFDKVEFDTPEECRRHEADNFALRLVGLTIEQINAALTRADVELADAIEGAAKRVKRVRLGRAPASDPPRMITHEASLRPCDGEEPDAQRDAYDPAEHDLLHGERTDA